MNRPKILCTWAVFYIYLIFIAIMIVLLFGSIVGAAVFPIYSLYISPYLPTSHNLNQYSNTANHTMQELLTDSFVYNNFSTNAMHIPDNYRQLLNLTLTYGGYSVQSCHHYLEDGQGLFTLIDDFQSFTQNKDAILATLPPIQDILSGLNATFYPYLDYLPLEVRLVKDCVEFIKEGNYTYARIKEFTDSHHMLTRDPLQMTVAEVIEVVKHRDFLLLVDPAFKSDIIELRQALMKNITELGTDIMEKTTSVYGRGYQIVKAFFNNEDLNQFEEIPDEFKQMFTTLQEKIVYYTDICVKLYRVIPQFTTCVEEQTGVHATELKQYMITSYLSYYKIHYIFTILVILVVILILVAICYTIYKGFRMMKETMNYAKALVQAASMEVLDALDDLAEAIENNK